MGDLIRRRLGTVLIIVGLFVLFSANRVAVMITDLWWFEARGAREVFTTILGSRILLGVVFGVTLTAVIAVNLWLARRMRPFFIPANEQQAQIQRYREMADPYLPWLIVAVALLFGVTSGLAVSAQWEPFLLWRNAQTVGISDPLFNRDVGFYLFEYPFLAFVQTWLFTSLLLVLLLTAGAHYLLGGIRPEAPGEKVLPNVKGHLAVLVALLLAVRGWGYWLGRYELLYSPRGTVTGASYTDVNAELPALYLLLGVTVLAIVLVLVSIRRRGLLLPGAAIALLVAASILLQGIYPAAIQRLRVDPQELAREGQFIGYNLEATRIAYGLDDVEFHPFSVANDLDEQDVIENDVTMRNVRLWDPDVLQTTFQELQALRPFYQFLSVDVDRYEIEGELRQVMIAARELSGPPSAADTWQNRHMTFTHGFGPVVSQVNTANPEGQPVFLARDIPPRGKPAVTPAEKPGIYFGEFRNPVYSLVRTDAPELAYEDPATREQVLTQYSGEGGVPINSLLRRTAYALRFNDYNLLLTNLLNEESRILYHRHVGDRVRLIAPFLQLDEAIYPVVLDGRMVWIVDAYTTSNNFPYSERSVLTTGNVQTPVNYVRNSVKAVVDAYDGTVELYVVDQDDPILNAWRGAFPGIFTDVEEAPEALVAHFRYPQDLFRLQAALYTSYHIPGVEAFYNRADEWEIPRDPAALANQGTVQAALADGGRAGPPLQPYYLLMRLPGEVDEEFVLIQPYLARGRDNMVAWLAGRSDGEHLGELFAVRFPADQLVLGPGQAQARIEQDESISEYITLRSREGSEVIRGNMQVLPVADSILYVVPLFLRGEGARIPELARVALVMGERTAFDRTFAAALGQLLGIQVPDVILDEEARDPAADPVEGDAPPTDDPGDEVAVPQELLREALAAFARAEEALRNGDLGTYQREVSRARDLLEQAARAQGITGDQLADDEAAAADGDA